MKEFKSVSITIATTFALFYIVGAFISADFNIAKWSSDLRGILGGFLLVLLVIVVPLAYTMAKDDDIFK